MGPPTCMHIYLEASVRLESMVSRGYTYVGAMAIVGQAFGLTQGERELMRWAFLERRQGGTVKPIRTTMRPRPKVNR